MMTSLRPSATLPATPVQSSGMRAVKSPPLTWASTLSRIFGSTVSESMSMSVGESDTGASRRRLVEPRCGVPHAPHRACVRKPGTGIAESAKFVQSVYSPSVGGAGRHESAEAPSRRPDVNDNSRLRGSLPVTERSARPRRAPSRQLVLPAHPQYGPPTGGNRTLRPVRRRPSRFRAGTSVASRNRPELRRTRGAEDVAAYPRDVRPEHPSRPADFPLHLTGREAVRSSHDDERTQ